MAKTISDEQMKLSIIINGDSAQKEINDLEKATIKLKHANSDLNYERKLIKKQLGEESSEYKALTREINKNSAEIESNETKITGLISKLKVTDRTLEQLTNQAALLSRQLKLMDPNSADFKKYSAELAQVSSRMGELKGKATAAKLSMGSMADSFNRYQGLALSTVAALTGVALSVQKIIDVNGKLSDAQADVMKTTGMTKDEVDELTKSFGALQTRTSRIDLLGIAEQGGRIGIVKEEIKDFVQEMNMAAVALGDSFTGGAEEVAEKLGKIKFLFAETKDLNVADAYSAIGSAINDLGANGVASEANIANFTTRIGSLTDVLKPTIQETLALGTAFEESGIEAEVSARAYNIFMKQASTESAKFAKVMGITQKSVEDMINKNPLDFMMKFAEGMRGMDATKTAKTLDFLGVNADGANKVIGAMGNNMGRFRELIDLSNNSFASGTSLINEYNIKNNNLAATLEKISKTVSGWFSSETFIKWLTIAVSWFADFIGATEEADKKVSNWRIVLAFTAKILAVLIGSLISYTAWTTLAAIRVKTLGEATAWNLLQQKLQVMWTSLQIAGLTIYTTVMNTFGFATTKASAALVRLNVVTKASPWGAVFAVLTAVVALYLSFKDSLDKATDSEINFTRQQKKLSEEVGKSTAATKAHLSSLIAIINDTNISFETRKKAYEQLIKIAPEFDGLIIKEGKTVNGLIGIYNNYIKALDQVAYAKGFAKLNEGNIEEEINAANRLYTAESKLVGVKTKRNELVGKTKKEDRDLSYMYSLDAIAKEVKLSEAEVLAAKTTLKDKKKIVQETNDFKTSTVATYDKNIKIREKNLLDLENKYGKEAAMKSSGYKEVAMKLAADKKSLDALIGAPTSTENPVSSFNVPGGKTESGKNKNSSKEAIDKLNYENNAKVAELSLKQQREIEDLRIANMIDGYEKELAIENQRFQNKIQDLEKRKVHAGELIKIDADIAKAKESGDKSAEANLIAYRAKWQKDNEALDKQIDEIKLGEIESHNIKLATIEEKGATEILKKKKESFDQDKILRDIKFNEELAALGNNKKAKEKLTEKHELEELEHQEVFLRGLIDDFNKIVGKGNFNSIDLKLLTPEQVQRFTEEAAKVGLTLAELIAKKNELVNGEKKSSNAEKLGVSKSSTDILGFTKENWQEFYDNVQQGKFGIDEMIFAVSALTDMYAKYGAMVTANENKQLQKFEQSSNAKKTRLKQQLDNGTINQDQYAKSVEKLDKDLDKKKAELSYKQAKRERMIAIASAISGTAMAVVGALGNKPWTPFNFALAGIVGALGALQIGTILSQPLPAKGYEEGLYGDYIKREQDGKVFKSRYGGKTKSGLVKDTSHFLVAENGPEMVIDNKAWRQMNPEVKDALVRELRGVKGFEQGLYNESLKRYEVPTEKTNSAPTANNDNQVMMMVMSMLAENIEVLKDLRETGVIGQFSDKDYNSIKKLRDGIKKYEALKNANKV